MSDHRPRASVLHAILRRIPELRGRPDDEQRQLWERASEGAMTRPAFLLLLAGYVAAIVLLPLVARRLFLSVANPNVPVSVIAGGVTVAIIGLGLWLFIGWPIRHARARLRRLLPHLCDACGYDLTGNASGVCPECGRPRAAGRETMKG